MNGPLISVIKVQVKWSIVASLTPPELGHLTPVRDSKNIMEPGKKRKKVRNAKKKQKSIIKANMTAEQKAEIRIKEKFNETLEIE